MPQNVFELHVTKMTELNAREMLDLASATALGAGRMDPSDARSLRRELVREAKYEKPQRVAGKEQFMQVMGAMGVPVRKA